MKHTLKPKDRKRVLQAAALVAILLLAAEFFADVSGGEAVLALLLLALGIEMLALHRSAESQARRQEALLSLFATVQPTAPLPDMQDWAAAPDLLKKLFELILFERPEVIVEAGSGVSTLICAAALRRLGRGRVIALEHEAQFAEQSRAWLALHGLSDYAQVVHAPLVPHTVSGKTWHWYDLSQAGIETVDLLLVDGPPRRTGPLARYPALPLLHRQLRSGGRILLDDAARRDEREIVRRWLAEFPGLTSQYLPGCCCVRLEGSGCGTGGGRSRSRAPVFTHPDYFGDEGAVRPQLKATIGGRPGVDLELIRARHELRAGGWRGKQTHIAA